MTTMTRTHLACPGMSRPQLHSKEHGLPWPVRLSWFEHRPTDQNVAGSIPYRGNTQIVDSRRQPINVSLSLSLKGKKMKKKNKTQNIATQNYKRIVLSDDFNI